MRDRLGLIEDEGDHFPGDGRPDEHTQPDATVTRHLHLNAKKNFEAQTRRLASRGSRPRAHHSKQTRAKKQAEQIQQLGGAPTGPRKCTEFSIILATDTPLWRAGRGHTGHHQPSLFQRGQEGQHETPEKVHAPPA